MRRLRFRGGGNPHRLPTPQPKITARNETGFTVGWDAVEHATLYVTECDGKEAECTETSATFDGLTPGETYTFRVKAAAPGDKRYTDSEWGMTTVTLDDAPSEMFEIRTEVTDLSVEVTITPADKSISYHADIITEKILAANGGDFLATFEKMLADYANLFDDEAFEKLRKEGDHTLRYDDVLEYDTRYYVVVAGIDEDLNITTEVSHTGFATEPVTPSDITFDLQTIELTHTSFTVRITPSNDDPYAYMLTDTKTVAGLQQEELRQIVQGYTKETYTGERFVNYTKNILPGSSYTLLVYGWDKAPTTAVTQYVIETPEGSSGSELTFELRAEVLSPTQIFTAVTPSDDNAVYFTNVIPREEYDEYGGDMERLTRDLCEESGISLESYIRYFSSVGYYEETYKGLIPDTEYVFYALGLEIRDDGEIIFFEPQLYDSPLKTQAE